jgi:hypothetical protein
MDHVLLCFENSTTLVGEDNQHILHMLIELLGPECWATQVPGSQPEQLHHREQSQKCLSSSA